MLAKKFLAVAVLGFLGASSALADGDHRGRGRGHAYGELRRRELKLGVVTNGPSAMQRRKLAALGIESAFDAILVSEEEGVSKPDPEIFRRALERCGVAAHEALFVGDHPVADIEGAHNAGLRVAWKFVPYWPPVVSHAPAIHSLSEVLALAV